MGTDRTMRDALAWVRAQGAAFVGLPPVVQIEKPSHGTASRDGPPAD